jgi:hypothetical protein
MARRRMQVKMSSFGLYSKWDKSSKELPQIVEFTTQIPARVDVEFGYTLNIRGGRGRKIDFTIEHPPFPRKNGDPAPSFTGVEHIRTNDYDFFVGDYIWEPSTNKTGIWRITCWCDGELIADKSFEIIANTQESPEADNGWREI